MHATVTEVAVGFGVEAVLVEAVAVVVLVAALPAEVALAEIGSDKI